MSTQAVQTIITEPALARLCTSQLSANRLCIRSGKIGFRLFQYHKVRLDIRKVEARLRISARTQDCRIVEMYKVEIRSNQKAERFKEGPLRLEATKECKLLPMLINTYCSQLRSTT
jgi:hypothetical protein